MRQKRVKLIRQALENKLATYERRIRQIAESAYKIRQYLEKLNSEVQTDAVHPEETEGSVSSGSVDNGTGGADLSHPTAVETVLDEQPAELRHDIGNIGIDTGRAV